MNRIAVITGSSRGIGLAVAEKFAMQGFDIVIHGRNQKELNAVANNIQTRFQVKVTGVAADLSSKDECSSFVRDVIALHSSIDVLVNNAGVFLPGTLMEESDDQMEKQMSTNFFSAYFTTKGLWTVLKKNERSHIINMCSIASITAYDAGGGYAVTKHALHGFTKSLRKEGIPFGIRVTSIMPGATYTDSWSSADLPQSRFMTTSDVANTVWNAWEINEHTVMEEVIIRPIEGDI
ncbi:MAG: SDR family oxidoreductase [Bacteroidota bacterium]|nr:SDR family oxidoreductase [Bacteroidota bacterium]